MRRPGVRHFPMVSLSEMVGRRSIRLAVHFRILLEIGEPHQPASSSFLANTLACLSTSSTISRRVTLSPEPFFALFTLVFGFPSKLIDRGASEPHEYFTTLPSLNPSSKVLGSAEARGRAVEDILRFLWASAGRRVRNRRGILDDALKGLNLVVNEVKYVVIMFAFQRVVCCVLARRKAMFALGVSKRPRES